MKKKLLTILAVLALVVAMVVSVVACTPTKTPTTKPPVDDKDDDKPTNDDKVDSKLVTESATALQNGITNLMQAALDTSDEKSYDATIFVKVKVGDDVDVDVKLHVAATFGATNSGLVDVVVGEQSYFTLYAAENTVYVGEALTQADMKWFKIDAVKDAAMLDKFFPQFLDLLSADADGNTLYKTINKSVGTYFGLIPMIGSFIFVQDRADGIVKEELAGGAVKYTNNVTFSTISGLLPSLKTALNLDIKGLVDGLDDGIKSIINIVCPIIFGGDLDALLDGTIDPEAAPSIQLNYTSKDGKLTDLELKYANDIAIGDSDKATAISVAFGFENVNITTNSKTAIATSAVTAGIKNAVEPAIKLSIAATVPEKDFGATVEAYVVPDVSLVVNRYAMLDGNRTKIESETHEGHTKDCVHFYNVDTVDMAGAKAYAIAKDKNGNVINLACDADLSKLASDGEIVLKFDLAGVYEILGLTAPADTKFQKTFTLWGEPDEEEQGQDVENATLLADAEAATNVIDQVVALFNGFEIGKVLGLLSPVMDFAKAIYNDVLAVEDTVVNKDGLVTIDVAKILEGLVANKDIQGSNSLKINGEKNLTEYLTSLEGVANLIDNIMRHSVKLEEGQAAPAVGSKYTEEELVELVKDYAGIDITDDAFENTKLVLAGIRGNKDKDEGIGFTAELQSEGKTVLTLTFKADIVDASTVPASTIGSDFVGGELDGSDASDTILDLLKDLHESYKAAQKAAA